jgi:hypothetical protein
LGIDAPERDAGLPLAACSSHDEVDWPSPKRETVKHINIIGPGAVGNELASAAVKVEDIQSSLLVCAEDKT